MKDLQKLADECKSQLDAIGIDYGNVTFLVNTRAKRRWGLCKVVGVNKYEISISSRLLQDEVADNAAKTTIIHELAHAADGCRNGHKGRWLKIAATIMKSYPEYNIKRCTSFAEKGFDEEYTPTKRLSYTYFYRCLGCGVEAKYKKATKFTRNPNAFYCIKCRGKFVTQAEYDKLTPIQRSAMNKALWKAAPKPLTMAEKRKIYDIKE